MPCTEFASTNTTDYSYVEETTCGTTPDDAAFQLLPTTGGRPSGNITTAVSEVIRADRMTDDLIVVDSEVSGSTNFELSYEAYKPIIESILRDSAPATIALTAQTWAITAATGAVVGTATSFTTTFKVGYFVKVTSATDPTIDGMYKIESITDDTNMNIGAGKVPSDSSQTDIAVDAIIHRNGTATAKSYTILNRIFNGASTSYFYERGCQFSQMSFNFETGSILKGSFDVVGKSETAQDTEYSGGTPTYADVNAYSLLNSVSSITEINLGGASATTEFSSVGLSINNNLNTAKAIGTLGSAAIAPFTLDIKADISVYFEDAVIYNQYINADDFYLDITLLDGDGNYIVMSLPKAKFSELSVPIDGRDSFLMQSGAITALRDVVGNYMVQFSFIPA